MSDERTIKVSDLNKRIDELTREYENTQEELIQERDNEERANFYAGKIEALQDLKIELNDPDPIIDTDDSVQEELNINKAKNITNPQDGGTLNENTTE